MIFTAKKINFTNVAIQVQAFRRRPKRLRLFSHNKKALIRGKRNCICDHILSENICRNINHSN